MKVNIQIPRCLHAAELALVQHTLQVLTDADLPDLAEMLCQRAAAAARTAVPGWTAAMRRARAFETLDLAGFPDQPKESTETP